MKIAISGKGGVGKTTISGTLCRLFGRRGTDVLAIDGDPNPNLSLILGIRDSAPPSLSASVLERVEEPDGKRRVQLGLSIDELLRSYGTAGPDNVTLVTVGQPEHAGTGCMCSSHAVVREVIHAAVAGGSRITVLDMEASLEHMKRGTARFVDTLYIVVEPYYRSLEAGRRLQRLGEELGIARIAAIANKVRTEADEEAVRDFCAQSGLTIAAVIPYDGGIPDGERRGVPLADLGASSPALSRLAELSENILQV